MGYEPTKLILLQDVHENSTAVTGGKAKMPKPSDWGGRQGGRRKKQFLSSELSFEMTDSNVNTRWQQIPAFKIYTVHSFTRWAKKCKIIKGFIPTLM